MVETLWRMERSLLLFTSRAAYSSNPGRSRVERNFASAVFKPIDFLSGPVAKLAHSNPCILFQNAINQIMAFGNLPHPEVVKRVRPEPKPQDSLKPLPEGPASTRQEASQTIDRKPRPVSEFAERSARRYACTSFGLYCILCFWFVRLRSVSSLLL